MKLSNIKNNKGKFILLVLYIFIVFLNPFFFAFPSLSNKVDEFMLSKVSKETDQFFRDYISLLKEQDVEKAYSLVSLEAQKNIPLSSMKKLSTYFSSTTNKVEIIGAYFNILKGDIDRTDYNFTYEIENNDLKYKYIITQIIARTEGDGIKIWEINVSSQTKSIKDQSGFNLSDNWLFLTFSIILPLFIAYTAFRYLTKNNEPKWGLFLVILLLSCYISFGNGKFGINVGVYGFMNQAGLWGPWVFMTPFPIGAIYYYFVRKKKEDSSLI